MNRKQTRKILIAESSRQTFDSLTNAIQREAEVRNISIQLMHASYRDQAKLMMTSEHISVIVSNFSLPILQNKRVRILSGVTLLKEEIPRSCPRFIFYGNNNPEDIAIHIHANNIASRDAIAMRVSHFYTDIARAVLNRCVIC